MYIIVMSIAVIYMVYGVLLFVMQRSFIYFPSDPLMHGYEEVVFENEGEFIRTILLNSGKKKAILYFGGNAEKVASNAPDFQEQFSSYSVYLVNYRGYGGSSGNPGEAALYSDALYIYDNLLSSYDSIDVIGRSLGSGVASYVASERSVEKLVLITPFDSIQNIAQKQFPLYPMSILLRDKFNSSRRAARIGAEVLILVAEKDKVIGRSHTDNLISSFTNGSPSVVIIENSGHNDISSYSRYYQSIREFLKFEEN